jgi:uncharacterized membrane protein (UPF0127 family)
VSPRIILIGTRDLRLSPEVFNTPASRWYGMRHEARWLRDGALFIMDSTGPHHFTMTDTPLPMDIVFVDRVLPDAGRVTGVLFGAPGNPGPYTGVGQIVLELPAGTCVDCGVTAGSGVLMSDVPG